MGFIERPCPLHDGSRLYRLGFTGGLDSAGKHETLWAWEAGKDEPYLALLQKRGLVQAHVDDMQQRKGAGERAGANYTNTEPCPLPDRAAAIRKELGLA